MNIEKITGYLNYRDEEHVFICENYYLALLPTTSIKLFEYKSSLIFDNISKPKANGFLADVLLEGICITGEKVYFCIQDNPSYKDGVFNYLVKWLYIVDKNLECPQIKGINFISQEINSFYNTKKYLKDDFDLKNGSFSNYTLSILPLDREKLGSFSYNQKKVEIYGDMSWKKNYAENNNFEMWSKITLEFEKNTSEIDWIYRISLLQKSVINFISYRLNNSFDSIETYSYNENNKRYISGKFYISEKLDVEKDYKILDRIIKSDNIKNIGKLYEMILKNKIYLNHIPINQEQKSIYTPLRMLGILISFERIINWKYTKEDLRNKKYLKLLERMTLYLSENKEDLIRDLTGQSIRFDKTVSRLSKAHADYASYVRKIIKDYPLSKIYIKNIYNTEPNPNLITTIVERIGKLRNDMAHGNMDFEFTIDNTKDLKFMEMLVYVIILKELEIEDPEIINKVNRLFNIQFMYFN